MKQMISRKWFSLLFWIISSMSLAGQDVSFSQEKSDSLWYLLSTSPEEQQPGIYRDLFDLWYDHQKDSALRMLNSGYDLAVKLGDHTLEADFLARFGRMQSDYGSPDSSIYFYRKSQKLSSTSKYKEGELNASLALINEYSEIGMADQGIELGNLYQHSIEMSGDTGLMIRFYLTMGKCYGSINEFDRAQKWFDEALRCSREHNNQDLAGILNRIAVLYRGMKDYPAAVRTLRESLTASNAMDAKLLMENYSELGTIMKERYQNEDSARHYFRKGLEVSEQLGYEEGKALMNLSIGMSFYRQQNHDQALPYLERSFDQLARINRYGEMLELLEAMEQIYYARGETVKAYHCLRRYVNLSGNLSSAEQNEEIKKLDYQNKVMQMDNEKELLDKDVRLLRQRSIKQLILIGSLLTLVLTLAFFQFRVNQKKRLLFVKLQDLLKTKQRKQKFIHVQATADPDQLGEKPDEEETGGANKPHIRQETITVILQRLQKWIQEKGFLERLTMNDVADRLHTNTKYLAEVISSEYHSNFTDFINQLRINYLLFMLREDPEFLNCTIESLAEKLGYGSRTTFIKIFKSETGLTPNYYLQQLRKASAEEASATSKSE